MKVFRDWFKTGKSYGCVTGDYAGQILIYVSAKGDSLGFLATPKMENLWVPKESFDFGLENGIIEYIERVPYDVRRTVKEKFLQNEGERL